MLVIYNIKMKFEIQKSMYVKDHFSGFVGQIAIYGMNSI